MATVKISPEGNFLLPKSVLDEHGIPEGAEVEISGGAREITLRLVSETSQPEGKKLTIEEFLARRIKYNGPPLTEERIREAMDQEIRRRWNEENGN